MTTAAAEDRDRVGPYRVIQAIGAGGSARIDLARIDRAYGFQRHVVVKRPLEHLRGDAGVAASLRREARIGGRLRHPNLVAILDAGIHDGYDYLVLEYVHGAALRTVMHADAPGTVRDLPLGVALAIVCDAARGMHEAHELTDDQGASLGLVHRDVSPGNILLGLDGTVKLADFGIAKETRVSTLSGSMHGTVTYMAPEQCQGHAFDRRADVFSLGVILYELVTGTRLFWADNDVASLHRVLSGTVPRPRKIKPQIPGALEDILMTAVAHAPERRFATALELAAALEYHAVNAGEVLGARWIARTVEAIVGPRPVPWIAAAAVPDAVPAAADGSLVELIAAIDTDEPVEPAFGDADRGADTGADEPVEATLPSAVPGALPAARRAAPRRRRLVLGIIALGAIGGAAAAALVMTRGSEAPAAIAAPPPSDRPGEVSGARDTPTDRARTVPAPDPRGTADSPSDQASDPRATADSPSGPHGSAVTPAAEPADHAAGPRGTAATPAEPADHAVGPRDAAPARHAGHAPAQIKHKPRATPRPPRTPVEPTGVAAPTEPAEAAAPPAAAPAPGPGSARPASKVEWKPTLLLPTDGSDGSDRR
jgi:serine/threonine-protein kinase